MKRLLAITFMGLASLLAGCEDDKKRAAATEPSILRVVNLVSDAPIISIDINASRFIDVSFGQASPVRAVSPANYQLTVHYSDPDGVTRTDLISEAFTLTSSQESTLIVRGTLAAPTVARLDDPSVVEIPENRTEVRFYNSLSTSQSVDVYLSNTPDSDSINGISPVTLTADGSNSLTEMASGSYRLLVTLSGDSDIVYDSGSFDLPSASRRMIAVVDSFEVDGNGVRGLVFNNNGTAAFLGENLPTAVRVANFIADQALVDVMIDGQVAFEDVPFGGVSEYNIGAPRDISLDVVLDGSATSIYDSTRTLVPGEARTLIVTGSASGSTVVQGRYLFDDLRRVSSAAKVRIVNAAPGSGNLDGYVLVPGQVVSETAPVLPNLTLLTNGSDLLQARDYDVLFTRAGEDTVLIGPQRVTLATGGVYSVFVSDAPGGGTPSNLVLLDDFAAE